MSPPILWPFNVPHSQGHLCSHRWVPDVVCFWGIEVKPENLSELLCLQPAWLWKHEGPRLGDHMLSELWALPSIYQLRCDSRRDNHSLWLKEACFWFTEPEQNWEAVDGSQRGTEKKHFFLNICHKVLQEGQARGCPEDAAVCSVGELCLERASR